MTTIATVRAHQAPVEASLKPVLYAVFAAKIIVAGLLVTAVNMPAPTAHADQALVAADF